MLNDALVRLVRDNKVDFAHRNAGLVQNLARRRGHNPRRKTEDGPPVHLYVMRTAADRLQAGRSRAAAGRNCQQLRARPVAAKHRSCDTARHVAGSQEHRAGAIPKQDAGRTIGPIHHPAQRFRANDQYVLGVSRQNLPAGDAESIHKTGTGRAQIKGAGIDDAQIVLDDAGCGWEQMLGRTGRADDQIHSARMEVGHLKRFARRLRPQRGAGLLGRGHDPSLLNPCSCANPLVLCIDNLLKIMVRDHAFGNLIAPADDLGITRGLYPVLKPLLRLLFLCRKMPVQMRGFVVAPGPVSFVRLRCHAPFSSNRRSIRHELWPPKPKLLLNVTATSACTDRNGV